MDSDPRLPISGGRLPEHFPHPLADRGQQGWLVFACAGIGNGFTGGTVDGAFAAGGAGDGFGVAVGGVCREAGFGAGSFPNGGIR